MVSSVSQKQRQLVQDRRLDLDYANSQYAYSRTNDKRQVSDGTLLSGMACTTWEYRWLSKVTPCRSKIAFD